MHQRYCQTNGRTDGRRHRQTDNLRWQYRALHYVPHVRRAVEPIVIVNPCKKRLCLKYQCVQFVVQIEQNIYCVAVCYYSVVANVRKRKSVRPTLIFLFFLAWTTKVIGPVRTWHAAVRLATGTHSLHCATLTQTLIFCADNYWHIGYPRPGNVYINFAFLCFPVRSPYGTDKLTEGRTDGRTDEQDP